MKFEEVKRREDYKFWCEGIECFVEDLIRSMDYSENEQWFAEKYQNGDVANWGIAVMELDQIDIELNITQYGAEYYLLIKDTNGDWQDEGYIPDIAAYLGLETASFDWVVDVSFDKPEWKEELERDMFRVLTNVIEKMGYKHNRLNETKTWRKFA